MSYILHTVRPANLQNWIKTNAVGSLRATARESWRAYLLAQGATGTGAAALEQSYLKAGGSTGKTLHDLWGTNATIAAASGGKNKEKIKNTFK